MIRTRSLTGGRHEVKGFACAFLLLLAPWSGAQPPIPPPVETEDQESVRFSVSVDLVLLHATVRDRSGYFVNDLRHQNFSVYEDRVPQRIRLFEREDVPVTVGLVIDHSGSMRPKMSDVIAAARTFVLSSNPADEMFIVNFNETVSIGLPDSIPFTNDPAELERAISKTPAEGQTSLYDAIEVALTRLQGGSREKKVLIVISDGGDNTSSRSLDQVIRTAGQSSAIIYTVGTFDAEDEDRNPDVLKRLARTTGGEAYFPAQREAVVDVCGRIAQDIRNQYILGYVSTNSARDGAHRSIRVVAGAAGRGKLQVRTRTGYIAGSDLPPIKSEVAK